MINPIHLGLESWSERKANEPLVMQVYEGKYVG